MKGCGESEILKLGSLLNWLDESDESKCEKGCGESERLKLGPPLGCHITQLNWLDESESEIKKRCGESESLKLGPPLGWNITQLIGRKWWKWKGNWGRVWWQWKFLLCTTWTGLKMSTLNWLNLILNYESGSEQLQICRKGFNAGGLLAFIHHVCHFEKVLGNIQ